MHYRLHTLLILLAVGPPLLAAIWIFWDIAWRVLIVLATPIVFTGMIVALGMAAATPIVVAVELISALRRLTTKGKHSDN